MFGDSPIKKLCKFLNNILVLRLTKNYRREKYYWNQLTKSCNAFKRTILKYQDMVVYTYGQTITGKVKASNFRR